MTLGEARAIALRHLKDLESGWGGELVLLDDLTRELEFGWVFFYDSKRHRETGAFKDIILGNAPLVVTKIDGKLHVTGTAHSVEYYLKRFENYKPGK